MARRFENRHRYPVSAERLFAIVTDPSFLVDRHRRQGAVSARVVELERSERRLVQEVETEEHVRSITGADRRRTESSATRYQWELAERRGHWSYHGSRGRRLHIGGEIAVVADGDGARLDSVFEVGVDAPLIGGVIERRILAEIEASLPAIEALTLDYCQRTP